MRAGVPRSSFKVSPRISRDAHREDAIDVVINGCSPTAAEVMACSAPA